MNSNNSLRRIRRAKDLTQRELAKQVGVSRTMICMIEKKNYTADDQLKRKIAKALGYSCRTIFPG